MIFGSKASYHWVNRSLVIIGLGNRFRRIRIAARVASPSHQSGQVMTMTPKIHRKLFCTYLFSDTFWSSDAIWHRHIGAGNCLSPIRHQAITLTYAESLSNGPPGTHVNEILFEIHTFIFTQIYLNLLSAQCRPLVWNVMCWIPYIAVTSCESRGVLTDQNH